MLAPAAPAMTDTDGLPPGPRHRATATIILGITLAVLDASIVNLALPTIARDLQASAVHAVWVVNAYQLAVLALLLPFAALGDLIGHRRVYLGGTVLFTAASLACCFATSLPTLIGARFLQGLGAAALMAVNTALVRLVFPRRLLGRGIALNSMVVATASVLGPTLAAAILSLGSWPWLFALNLPLGLVVFALGLGALPANPGPRPPGTRVAPLDVLLNAGMFVLVFLAAETLGTRLRGPEAGTALAVAGGLLAAGLLVGFAYVRRQRRQPLPILPLDLLRLPVFALSMGTSVAAFAAQMLAFIALPFLLIEGHARTPLEAGLLFTAWPVATILAAPLAGRLIGRIPDAVLGGIGLMLMAAGLTLLALLPAEPSAAGLVWRLALCGAGFGLFQSPNNHTIVTSAPAHRSGGASGMLGTARLTGQTTGAVLMATLFSIAPALGLAAPAAGLAVAAALAALAGVLSMQRLRHARRALAA